MVNSSATDDIQSNASPQKDNSSSASSAEPKYTQDQYNKGMSEKDAEIRQKLTAQLSSSYAEAMKSEVASATSEATRRANMTADQKRLDDAKKSKASYSEVMSALKSYQVRDAKRSAIDDTTKALNANGVSDADDIAPLLANADIDQRNTNIKAFTDFIKKHDEATKNNLTAGKVTPQSAPTGNFAQTTTDTPSPHKKVSDMSPSEVLAWIQSHPSGAKNLVTRYRK